MEPTMTPDEHNARYLPPDGEIESTAEWVHFGCDNVTPCVQVHFTWLGITEDGCSLIFMQIETAKELRAALDRAILTATQLEMSQS